MLTLLSESQRPEVCTETSFDVADELTGAAEDGTAAFTVVIAILVSNDEITFADDMLIGLMHLSCASKVSVPYSVKCPHRRTLLR